MSTKIMPVLSASIILEACPMMIGTIKKSGDISLLSYYTWWVIFKQFLQPTFGKGCAKQHW